MTDKVTVRGLRTRGYHGVFEAERRLGQIFVVDAVLEVDTRPAANSDDLADAIDYGELALSLSRVIEGDPVDLIETLAQRLADTCLRDERVTAVEVTVHKPQAPVPVAVDDMTVTIRRTRG